MTDTLLIQLAVGILVGLGAGYVGAFMVLKRMSLVGDALSHVALPGIALSLLFGINPFWGGFGILFLVVLGIWALEKETELPSETLVGFFFTISLAVGLILTPEPELLEALFGNISQVTINELAITLILVSAILWIVGSSTKDLMLDIISSDLAESVNRKIHRINLVFLISVSLIVALGLKVAGTLLMGSLVIIPAASSKNVSINLSNYTLVSALIGAFSALIGILIANQFDLSAGPIIVLTSGVIFILTFLYRKNQ